MNRLPLLGITVVSLEQAVSAPFATRQLADLGARVIKIERSSGDFARGYDSSVRGMSSYFAWLNRAKESVVLDLKSSEGKLALNLLVERADVLVQNLAPGAINRLGLDGATSLAINPRLVHASISGYGEPGEYSGKKAYDLMIQCESGLMSVTGSKDEAAKVGISIADIASGMYLYSGILGALYHREHTGSGAIIELAMLDAVGEWMMQPFLYSRYGGQQPPRSGAHHPTIAPYGPFEARDGVVFFGIQNEREWAGFCRLVLELPEIASDAELANNVNRVLNREKLNRVILGEFSKLDTAEVLRRLDEAGIANARLRTITDFAAHPQFLARDRWIEVDSPAGAIQMLAPPVTSDSIDYRIGKIPELGEHTETIMHELGLRND